MGKHEKEIKELSVCPYNYDVWKKLYPLSTKDMWKAQNQPNNILNLVYMLIGQLEEEGISTRELETVNIIPLDEEYLAWEGSKKEYCEQMTPEKALSLLRKNRMDWIFHVACIPVCMNTENYRPAMGKEKEDILEALKKQYPDDKVFLPGYYFTKEKVLDFYELLIRMAKVWVENDAVIRCKLFDIMEIEEGEQMLYIPFVICERLKKTTFSIQELYDSEGEYSRKFFLPSKLEEGSWMRLTEDEKMIGRITDMIYPILFFEGDDSILF